MREATVTLSDGRVLGYAEHGDPEGAPIIYNHPLPRGPQLQSRRACAESRRRAVVHLERPGIGLSIRAPGRTLADWPADVAEFAEALGIDRFAVVGVSAGGPYALSLAIALPERVTCVGLVCALGGSSITPSSTTTSTTR
jgi:pimeloyl-ACP methyl ester carboxylesterase